VAVTLYFGSFLQRNESKKSNIQTELVSHGIPSNRWPATQNSTASMHAWLKDSQSPHIPQHRPYVIQREAPRLAYEATDGDVVAVMCKSTQANSKATHSQQSKHDDEQQQAVTTIDQLELSCSERNLSMSSRMGMGPWLRLKKRSTGVMYDAARSRRAGSALNGSCVR